MSKPIAAGSPTDELVKRRLAGSPPTTDDSNALIWSKSRRLLRQAVAAHETKPLATTTAIVRDAANASLDAYMLQSSDARKYRDRVCSDLHEIARRLRDVLQGRKVEFNW